MEHTPGFWRSASSWPWGSCRSGEAAFPPTTRRRPVGSPRTGPASPRPSMPPRRSIARSLLLCLRPSPSPRPNPGPRPHPSPSPHSRPRLHLRSGPGGPSSPHHRRRLRPLRLRPNPTRRVRHPRSELPLTRQPAVRLSRRRQIPLEPWLESRPAATRCARHLWPRPLETRPALWGLRPRRPRIRPTPRPLRFHRPRTRPERRCRPRCRLARR